MTTLRTNVTKEAMKRTMTTNDPMARSVEPLTPVATSPVTAPVTLAGRFVVFSSARVGSVLFAVDSGLLCEFTVRFWELLPETDVFVVFVVFVAVVVVVVCEGIVC